MTITLPLVIDVLLILLLTAGTVSLVYITIVLVRVNIILRRIDQVVGYTARIQGIIESWEALPKQIFGWALDVIPQFFPKKGTRSGK
jgi:hypothetical protein